MRPPVNLGGDVGRVIDDIYRILDQILKSVNQPAAKGGTSTDAPGKSGDVRVVRGDSGQTHLEIKTDEGWARSVDNTFSKV